MYIVKQNPRVCLYKYCTSENAEKDQQQLFNENA